MKHQKTIRRLRTDYELRSFLTSSISLLSTAAFWIYNLVISLLYHSVWNFSISFYYMVLFLLRGLILFCERKWRHEKETSRSLRRRCLFQTITRVVLLLDFSLVIPISLMVLSQRPVRMTIIPAITVAAYTTYKVIFAILNYLKTRNHENLSLFGLKMLNLKDAVVSVLTLQNTLVMVFSSGTSMLTLTAYTSAGMLLAMLIFTVLFIQNGRKLP